MSVVVYCKSASVAISSDGEGNDEWIKQDDDDDDNDINDDDDDDRRENIVLGRLGLV